MAETLAPSIYTATTLQGALEPFYAVPYQIYRDADGNTLYETSITKVIEYANSPGMTYLGPFISGINPWFFQTTAPGPTAINTRFIGLTSAPVSEESYYVMKNLSEGRRGVLGVAMISGTPPGFNQFFEDRILEPSSSTNRTYYKQDWTTTTSTGALFSIWPTTGVSSVGSIYKTWLQSASNTGATVDYIMTDTENLGEFQDYIEIASRRTALIGNTQFFNPWQGISSIWDYYQYAGGITITGTTYDSDAWRYAKERYRGHHWKLAVADPLQQVFPNSMMSNYDFYEGLSNDETYDQNSCTYDGRVDIERSVAGNASSPVLYGWVRQAARPENETLSIVSVVSDFYRTKLITREQRQTIYSSIRSPFDKIFRLGPWTSFMFALAELREGKRHRPDLPSNPWISDALTTMDTAFALTPIFDRSTSGSPPEVLHNSWNRLNFPRANFRTNLADYAGSSTAISMNNVGMNGVVASVNNGIYYRYNITGITFEGNTSTIQINTIGTTGVTAALALYMNNITSGVTYVFSYEIDLDRGFTGGLSRFILWNTTDNIYFAPWRPTSTTNPTGITYQQILPVTSSFVNRESTIGYTSGDSGWTKVAWRFIGPSTPRVGMNLYYAPNSGTTSGGYTAYLRNPTLIIESSGATVSINPFDSRYYPTTSNTLFEYAFNGLTSGITYVWSYYNHINNSTGLTFFGNQQRIDHLSLSKYGLTNGITFYQTLPVTGGPHHISGNINYSSSTGWTKFEWEFLLPPDTTSQEILFNPTTRLSTVYNSNYYYSLTDASSREYLAGITAFFSHAEFGTRSGTGISSYNTRQFLDEYNHGFKNSASGLLWNTSAGIGIGHATKGYNEKEGMYYTDYGGNSAYYYELVRHVCMHGTKGMGFFPIGSMRDYGVTGTYSTGRAQISSGRNIYLLSGKTTYIPIFSKFNEVMQEIHDNIKGYTLTCHTDLIDWTLPYVYSGVPDTKGNTWVWRLTVKPGYTLYCNGNTLSAFTNPGMWIKTPGSCFGVVNISTEIWPPPITPPDIGPVSKEINFLTMSNISDLTSAGCTFSRGSTATYIDSNGKVTTVGPNVPRFEYFADTLQPRGLLLENAATNLINWSEAFALTGGSQNNWVETNLTRSLGNTAPSGITNSIRFTANSSNASLMSSTAASGSTYAAFSIWIRGITGNENVFYTLNNGITWSGISGISNSWQRFGFGPVTVIPQVGIRIGNTGQAIELWGAQVENRTFSDYAWNSFVNNPYTSYIKTDANIASRMADICNVEGISFSSWFGSTYGTIAFENERLQLKITGTGSNNFISYQPYDERRALLQFNSSAYSLSDNTIDRSLYDSLLFPLNTPTKFAYTYSPMGWQFCQSFNYSYSGSVKRTPIIEGANKVEFRNNINGFASEGHARKFQYWNYSATESELKQLARSEIQNYGVFNPHDRVIC
jgi:hypothetical protein